MLWTTSGDTIDDCVKDVSVNDEKGEGIWYLKKKKLLNNILFYRRENQSM